MDSAGKKVPIGASYLIDGKGMLRYGDGEFGYLKLVDSDMDGVWNSKDSPPPYACFVQELSKKNSQYEKILGYLKSDSHPAAVIKAVSNFMVDMGTTEELVKNAYVEAASSFDLVQGAHLFIRDLEKMGYSLVMNSLSPLELVREVCAKRLGFDESSIGERCAGTSSVYKDGMFRGYIPNDKLVFRDRYLSNNKASFGAVGLEVVLSDDPRPLWDGSLVSGIGPMVKKPSIWATDSKDLPNDTSIRLPAARSDISLVSDAILKYEFAYVKSVLMSPDDLSKIRGVYEKLVGMATSIYEARHVTQGARLEFFNNAEYFMKLYGIPMSEIIVDSYAGVFGDGSDAKHNVRRVMSYITEHFFEDGDISWNVRILDEWRKFGKMKW